MNKTVLILFIFQIIFIKQLVAYDALKHAPPSFEIGETRAVFVDFKTAQYYIYFDYTDREVLAETVIDFEMKESGAPVIDLIPGPIEVIIDGEEASLDLYHDPTSVTKLRVLSTELSPGRHILEIKNYITKNVKFENGGVHSAFWMSDLADRSFLERYLPTNFEFDQFQIGMTVEFAGKIKKPRIYTNGQISEINHNKWEIEFPEYYTTSSLYFHTAPEGTFEELTFNYQSVDGREIPVTIYAQRGQIGAEVHNFKNKALITLGKLENNYGPWLHDSITIYGVGRLGKGGMEYCGATMTDMYALSHELTHSYFARGIMPTSGNAGWIDEAIASWRDRGYLQSERPNFTSTQMAAHSPYTRITDTNAYFQGASFMAYLNHLLDDKGGLIAFLNTLLEERAYTPINTQEFRSDLEKFAERSFQEDFDQYIYGRNDDHDDNDHDRRSCPYQLRLSDREYFELL